ncbi:gamma-glutamyl-gamma-aminobutyrate hydrolase family protein [Bacillus litorisediminis]|uniref:gamma-glutamyl-gamma-aminobutyrate hydrolase family protein n=1 Tax=Bacillus litorisediminis TaxID=2922713 RepID=UPI001FAB9F5F|nr:gamma-glutamyl-gamma-aminobutyrate hydrolase family protein [Bacillus litorisediminis]
MKKPIIGVVPLFDEKKDSYWMLPGYMKGIEDAGGIPVMLPLTTDKDIISSLALAYDGFLFTGGQDINPELYGEKTEVVCGAPCEERDVMENILFKQCIELNKPVFGICRGIQLFNVLLGGTLYQDIPTQMSSNIVHTQKPPYDVPVHRVIIEKETPLYDILGTEFLMVNSYHHQGIKTLSPHLLPAAKADDGLIEAVYMPEKKFAMAVQWHPEFNYKVEDTSFRLFVEFVNSCKIVQTI